MSSSAYEYIEVMNTVPRQMKYAFVLSTFWYHFFKFSRPDSIEVEIHLNFALAAIFSQDCCKNSRIGMVRQADGF